MTRLGEIIDQPMQDYVNKDLNNRTIVNINQCGK